MHSHTAVNLYEGQVYSSWYTNVVFSSVYHVASLEEIGL